MQPEASPAVGAQAALTALSGVALGLSQIEGAPFQGLPRPAAVFPNPRILTPVAAKASFVEAATPFEPEPLGAPQDVSGSECPLGGKAFREASTGAATFQDCASSSTRTLEGGTVDVVIVRNGSQTRAADRDDFNYKTVRYRELVRRASDGLSLSEYVEDLTIRGTLDNPNGACRTLEGDALLTAIDAKVAGQWTFKEDRQGDGLVDVDQEVDVDFRVGVDLSVEEAGCTLLGAVITFRGEIKQVDSVGSRRRFLVRHSGDPVTMTLTHDAEGDALLGSIDGAFYCEAECFRGTVVLETTQDIVFTDDGAGCPIEGELAVKGDIAGKVVFTAEGGLEVDEGSDGTVDVAIPGCAGVEACPAPAPPAGKAQPAGG